MQVLKKNEAPDFDTIYAEEIRESEKHDIISRISQYVEGDDHCICKAEKIFDEIKFAMASFVMKHEYGAAYFDHQDMHFWLEENSNPKGAEKLQSIIDSYLK